MSAQPMVTLRTSWPRESLVEQHLGALAVLATMDRGPLLLSSTGSRGHVTHDLGAVSYTHLTLPTILRV